MHDYQRSKNNPYYLPKSLYRRILWLVRDYERLKSELDAMLYEGRPLDGMPRGSDISDPTAKTTIKRERLREETEAVEQGKLMIPEEYRRGVWEHVTEGVRFPDYAHYNTWKSWQARFLYQIAKRLGEI